MTYLTDERKREIPRGCSGNVYDIDGTPTGLVCGRSEYCARCKELLSLLEEVREVSMLLKQREQHNARLQDRPAAFHARG